MLETPTVQMSPSKQRRPEIAPALSLAGPEPVGNSAPGVFRQNLGGRYANKAVEGQADSPADCESAKQRRFCCRRSFVEGYPESVADGGGSVLCAGGRASTRVTVMPS